MRPLRFAWKLLRTLAHVLAGVLTVWLRFPRLTQPERHACVQRWALQLMRVLGIDVVVEGQVPTDGPLLLVANHISWLDIPLLHAARHCRFVSKAGVRRWPVVGMLATAAGTLYIERESRRDAMRVVQRMSDSLREGDVLAVFPEGTTSEGSSLLPFHANLLQAPIAAQAPVMPVALRYVDAATGKPSRAAAYVGDDTLVGSVLRVLWAPPIRAVVCFGAAQQPASRDRRSWARELHAQVAQLRGDAGASSSWPSPRSACMRPGADYR